LPPLAPSIALLPVVSRTLAAGHQSCVNGDCTMKSHESDIIVIGAGVAGLSTAWQLAKRGKKVRVFDQGPLLHGSTGRASGLIGQLRSTPYATRMLMEGLEILRELEDVTDTKLYHQTGSIRIAQTEARVAELE